MSSKNESKQNKTTPSSIGKHTKAPGYEPGNHWVVCDSTGFDIRAKDIRMTWDGRAVCPEAWEPRHPQDFVRAVKDDISASQPIRPVPSPIEQDIFFKLAPAIAGVAIAGGSICGDDAPISTGPGVPPGTFNPNTL